MIAEIFRILVSAVLLLGQKTFCDTTESTRFFEPEDSSISLEPSEHTESNGDAILS